MAKRRLWTVAWAASVAGVLVAGTPALAFPYEVEAGEDLNELGARFQIAPRVLAQANGLRAQPRPGQTIQIPYQQHSSAAKAPPTRATAAELEVLARIIKGECPPAVPYIGKVAVAAVVLNRVRSRSFPNSITGVAHQPYQFSSYNRKYRQQLYYGAVPDWCFAAARAALEGMDPTDNCTYYFNPFLVKPSWARGMTFVLRIGDSRLTAHDFYRPPSESGHGNGTNLAPVAGRGDAAVASSAPEPRPASSRPASGARPSPSSAGSGLGSSGPSSLFSSPTGAQNGGFGSSAGSTNQGGASVASALAPWDPGQVTGLTSLFPTSSAPERGSTFPGVRMGGPARLGMSDLLSRLDGTAAVGSDGVFGPGAGWVDDPEAKVCRVPGAAAAESPDEDRNALRRLLAKVGKLLGLGDSKD